MEGNKRNEGSEREEIFSRAVRAGKRTYFFDVKATKGNDYYLTITESKKRYEQDGRYHFEKHKLFLYKEDFEKFTQGLTEVVEFIKNGHFDSEQPKTKINEESDDFTDVDFDDLDEDDEER